MVTQRLQTCLIVALGFISLSGCLRGPVSWQRVTLNQPISTQDVNFIVDGETSISAVVEKLGAPNQMLAVKDGVLTRYYFSDGKDFRVDYGWGLRFVIPFYSPDLTLGGGGVGTDVFQVRYNNQWIVQYHAFAIHSQSSEFRIWPFRD
jgi:hypothetical protein